MGKEKKKALVRILLTPLIIACILAIFYYSLPDYMKPPFLIACLITEGLGSIAFVQITMKDFNIGSLKEFFRQERFVIPDDNISARKNYKIDNEKKKAIVSTIGGLAFFAGIFLIAYISVPSRVKPQVLIVGALLEIATIVGSYNKYLDQLKPYEVEEVLTPKEQVSAADQEILLGQARVFVSHSSKDDDFGIHLVTGLRHELGDDSVVWYDSQGGLYGGDVWWDEIVQEITERNIFILILSPDTFDSQWIRDEFRIAWDQKNSPIGKRIIPVICRPCRVRSDLGTLQVINFLPPKSYDKALNQLVEAIKRVK